MLVYILTFHKLRLRQGQDAGHDRNKAFFYIELQELRAISTGPVTVFFMDRLWNEDCTSALPKVDYSVRVVMGMDYGISHRFLVYQ
jgi:hypothetical protein